MAKNTFLTPIHNVRIAAGVIHTLCTNALGIKRATEKLGLDLLLFNSGWNFLLFLVFERQYSRHSSTKYRQISHTDW